MKSTATVSLVLLLLSVSIAAQTVQNTSSQVIGQERVLRIEVIVPNSTQDVWAAFSTVEGLQRWAAPVVALDLRAGGSLRAHYDEGAEIGSPGTIETTILNYLEGELITFKVNLNEAFPEEIRAEDSNLQEIVQFVPHDNGGTKLVSTMVGWGAGPAWDEAYIFLRAGMSGPTDSWSTHWKNSCNKMRAPNKRMELTAVSRLEATFETGACSLEEENTRRRLTNASS